MTAVVWVSSRRSEKDRATKQELGKLEDRIVEVEKDVATAPHLEAVHDIALSVTAMAGDIKAVSERLGGVSEMVKRIDLTVSRHESHLLEGGKAGR